MAMMIDGFLAVTWKEVVMMLVGAILIYLGIKKQYEPTLLIPMGLGAIMVNIPNSGMITQAGGPVGVLDTLFKAGIETELFPLLIFIGIGAMIDFGPLLQNPSMLFFGAAAQFGIFFTLFVALFAGFSLPEAASIGIIGAADGPTSVFVSGQLAKNLLGPITVAAYSYMSLVPIIQPPAIKLVTTKAERQIRMHYTAEKVSKRTKILFPIIITVIAGFVAPASLPLVGFLMYGNLMRECGVLDRLSDTAQNALVNLITILLGLSIASTMTADQFLTLRTIYIIGFGLMAFVMDSIGGVLFCKVLNLFRREKLNAMIGAAGISAFPMSARVVQKLATEADPKNFILNYAISANVAGQIGSVVAGGLILGYFIH